MKYRRLLAAEFGINYKYTLKEVWRKAGVILLIVALLVMDREKLVLRKPIYTTPSFLVW